MITINQQQLVEFMNNEQINTLTGSAVHYVVVGEGNERIMMVWSLTSEWKSDLVCFGIKEVETFLGEDNLQDEVLLDVTTFMISNMLSVSELKFHPNGTVMICSENFIPEHFEKVKEALVGDSNV